MKKKKKKWERIREPKPSFVLFLPQVNWIYMPPCLKISVKDFFFSLELVPPKVLGPGSPEKESGPYSYPKYLNS